MKKHTKVLSIILALIMLFTSNTTVAYAASKSTMVSKVISIAENEVGYAGTRQYSKYGDWYGYQGAWCTTFAIWCYYKAGDALDVQLYGKIVPSGGNCNSMISWYKNKGRYHTKGSGYTPKAGDFIFLDWSGNGSAQHVGIVTGTSGSTIYTIEGNCGAKVKKRQYTTSGSKPYNNVSAILGFGSPDWESVATTSDKKPTTTKKATKKKKKKVKSTTTTKATTVAKKKKKKKKKTTTTTTTTTEKATKEKDKKDDKDKDEDKTKDEETTTEKETTSAPILVKKMDIYAATTDLEIGDSVSLDYTIKPSNAQAVVDYFCDEENIIEISQGGKITAIGEGTATVVVCANDEIYKQCDFKVTTATTEVTKLTGDKPVLSPEQDFDDDEDVVNIVTEKDNNQKLLELGVNADQLASHKDDYIYPLSIAGATASMAVVISLIKLVIKKRKK